MWLMPGVVPVPTDVADTATTVRPGAKWLESAMYRAWSSSIIQRPPARTAFSSHVITSFGKRGVVTTMLTYRFRVSPLPAPIGGRAWHGHWRAAYAQGDLLSMPLRPISRAPYRIF